MHASPIDEEDLFVFDTAPGAVHEVQQRPAVELDIREIVWRALVIATHDYVHKNGFTDIVIGLSGGIDSSVVAAIAVDALGAAHVHGVAMPGPYSSEASLSDARSLAANLGITCDVIPITGPLEAFERVLAQACGGSVDGLAAENLQARVRTVELMTIANSHGWLMLNCGNKSEAAMGFSTLYGDTAGAFAPIGDIYKTEVYELAQWRNTHNAVIPQPPSTRNRAPSSTKARATSTVCPRTTSSTSFSRRTSKTRWVPPSSSRPASTRARGDGAQDGPGQRIQAS